jgi:2-dehydropantoate 2-reductase
MRVLVVGAGAVGGYFGGRLAEAGRDVTFLVRPKRAAELAASGLTVLSRYGDIAITAPQTALAGRIGGPFDLVLLSCKAYDLESAVEDFAPAVGPQTAILPLLNGMRHLDILKARFGGNAALGGQCFIAATLDENRRIVQLSEHHGLTCGELDGAASERIRAIERLFEGAKFDGRSSTAVILDMWEKWVVLTTLAGSTCLMRAAIGDILKASGGAEFVMGLFEECRAIAQAEGSAPRDVFVERSRATLLTPGSPLTASMMRDIEGDFPVEADHIVGDLLERGKAHGLPCASLQIVFIHLKAYEARRARSASVRL